ncbi:MAG: hypothetical protein KA165_19710, partial [Saprospiraceae bacterium]|nr:hypothetical protein [Saprospiraceae bacterium]
VKAYWNTGGTPDSLSGLVAGGGTIGVFGTVDDFPAGAAVIHYVATDSCGNTGACDLNLQVWDGAPPTAGCVLFSAVNLSAAGTASISAAALNNGSADDCGTLTFKARRADAGPCQPNTQFYNAAAFCCADIGDTVAVILRVYDVPVPPGAVSPDLAATQSAECISYIKIEDNNGPVCAPPADITVTCDVFDPALATYGDLVSQSCAVDSVLKTADYSLFDTICSRGTINRVFRVFDAGGNSGACTQRITVDYDQDYYVRFPNDVIVTLCDGTGNFGTPAFSGNDCESLEATFADQIFYIVPDACYKIERTWTIINRCAYDSNAALIVVPNPNPSPVSNHALNLPGPVVSAPGTSGAWAPTQVKINPSDPQATNFSTFWSDTSNGYQYKQIIKILDSQKPLVQNCPGTTGSSDTTANDPLLWNETYWMAPGGGNDLPDAPAELTVTATDLCSGANLSIHCVLFLDLDGNGTKETAIDSYNPPAPGYVNFNNAANPNYSGGTSRRFDERFVTPDEQYRFAVHQSIDGQKLTATLQWKTLAQMPGGNGPLGLPGIAPQLPHGTHSIKWFVTDNCGNEAVCSHDFLIDNTAPFITCDSAISIEIPPNSFASLLVDDLLATFGDNTPGDQLAFSLRKAGAGSGFPLNNAGDPVSTLTYPCSETGAQTAELWVQDLAGNTAFCETLVTVTDADSSCFYSPLTVAGQFSPAVEGVGVTLAISPLQAPPVNLTDVVDGSFEFADAVPHGADYTLTPLKNSNPLNGVSTYDLVLITQHILNLQPLDSPQKLIAADVNKSNLVTTFDVVELRKLILGIYNVFPNNTSWRFIDKDFVFPDPNNPFLTPFPEFITRADVTMDQLEDDFTAVKVGDVNGTALVNDLVPVDDRSAGTLFFDLANRQVKTGEEFSARFKGSEPVLGYQFTLMYDGLEVLDILPATGVPNDRFAVFPGEPGTGAVTASVTEPVNEFAVRFRAVKNGRLSDLLRISSRITRAEAYGNCGNYGNCPLLVALRFGDAAPEDGSRQGLELDQNVPNPFDDATVIGFNLPADSDLTWTITDETGRLLRTESAHFKQGRHTIQ